MANVIRAGFSGEQAPVTLRLVEDQDGKRLVLPDGRHIAGVVDVNLAVRPNDLTTMTIVLVNFEADMNCPTRERKHDGDR